jgi:hypothetical protein
MKQLRIGPSTNKEGLQATNGSKSLFSKEPLKQVLTEA